MTRASSSRWTPQPTRSLSSTNSPAEATAVARALASSRPLTATCMALPRTAAVALKAALCSASAPPAAISRCFTPRRNLVAISPTPSCRTQTAFFTGETCYGGTSDHGVFFRYDLGLPEFVSFLGTYGRVGMTVQILGQNFTGDSEVSFNGVAAQVTEVQPTFSCGKTTVPEGATTGWITVTTSKGTVKSNKQFIVRPWNLSLLRCPRISNPGGPRASCI